MAQSGIVRHITRPSFIINFFFPRKKKVQQQKKEERLYIVQEKFFLLPRRSSIVHRLCACGCLLRAEAAGHTKKRAWASFFYPHFFPVGHCLFLSGYIKKKVLPQELRVFAPTMKEVQRTVKKRGKKEKS